jgi:hypothetical protein
MKRGRTLKNLNDKSSGMEILMTEAFAKINPLTFEVCDVYYESIKRELKIKPTYECRCDGRLQTKTKRFTRLSNTGLVVKLEHLKIKTKLTNEKFTSVKGECEI